MAWAAAMKPPEVTQSQKSLERKMKTGLKKKREWSGNRRRLLNLGTAMRPVQVSQEPSTSSPVTRRARDLPFASAPPFLLQRKSEAESQPSSKFPPPSSSHSPQTNNTATPSLSFSSRRRLSPESPSPPRRRPARPMCAPRRAHTPEVPRAVPVSPPPPLPPPPPPAAPNGLGFSRISDGALFVC